MKRSKALTLAMLALTCAIIAFGNSQFGLAALCLAPALLFGGIWFAKSQRDAVFVSKAHEQRERQQHQPTQPLEMTQTITSKRGSTNNGLFVPPPLP